MFNTIILYHYTLNNEYTRYNICSAWVLDIRISTCFEVHMYSSYEVYVLIKEHFELRT